MSVVHRIGMTRRLDRGLRLRRVLRRMLDAVSRRAQHASCHKRGKEEYRCVCAEPVHGIDERDDVLSCEVTRMPDRPPGSTGEDMGRFGG